MKRQYEKYDYESFAQLTQQKLREITNSPLELASGLSRYLGVITP